jgi:hypothetical protein
MNPFKISLTLVASFCVLAISGLHAQHLGSYKTPKFSELDKDTLAFAAGRWNLFHFVVKECECSKTLLKHLIDRGPLDSTSETIVLINGDSNSIKPLIAKGYKVETPSTDELRKKGLDLKGLPLLVIYDPHAQVQYNGGYSSRKINLGTQFEDVEIFNQLQKGFQAKSLPVFGCPVSDKTKSILTAFNLSFSKWEEIQ